MSPIISSFASGRAFSRKAGSASYITSATGGTKTTSGSYTVHTFTTVGNSTFTCNGTGRVEYLIVGGGGAGGWDEVAAFPFKNAGGGGGGGGILMGVVDITPGNYTITVGKGGNINDSDGGTSGSGGNSSAFGLTALGGGGGGNNSDQNTPTRGSGANGGSGGGAAGDTTPGSPGSGTVGQGYRGGSADSGSSFFGGAGGGYRWKGQDNASTTTTTRLGGPGAFVFISGSGYEYSRGGRCTTTPQIVSNYGFGGEGTGIPDQGTNGFQGIVIIRYLTSKPSPDVQQIGSSNTYDATGYGPVKSITDFEGTSVFNNLPSRGYLKYILNKNTSIGGDEIVLTYFVKSGSQICQSAFHMDSYSVDSTTSILNYDNDDHDTLCMAGNGLGLLARSNTNMWFGNFDTFIANSEFDQNKPLSTCLDWGANSFVEGYVATPIAFPASNTTVWWKLGGNNQYSIKVNNFTSQSVPSGIINLGFSTNNNIWTVSDGVNCCFIGSYINNVAYYVEFDLETGGIYKWNAVNVFHPNTNPTEEDACGCQLFAVNADWSWHESSYYWWTPKSNAVGWRFRNFRDASNSNSVGSNDTQTQADIWGSIGYDNRVWFADWGHDNGGLFNFGDDNQLGIARSSIYLLDPYQVLT